jgi:hypothetical protein
MSEAQQTTEMPMTRLSKYKRAEFSGPGKLTIKARTEVGRGKRFGTAGELSLSNQEAIQLAKFVLNNYIDSENPAVNAPAPTQQTQEQHTE